MELTRQQIELEKSNFRVEYNCGDITEGILRMRLAICDLALSALDREWRSIETAPKDGTHIFGCVNYTDQPMTVVYFGGFHPNSPGKSVWRDAFSRRPVQEFDAYMPLPEPPKGVSSEQTRPTPHR